MVNIGYQLFCHKKCTIKQYKKDKCTKKIYNCKFENYLLYVTIAISNNCTQLQ